mmetsp:Transcript_9301/g.34409  ORF Transcript_9301/g.34409 Transcript_9301/m.34409 type:complete len:258 (-) Transcript_9301:226-999(-)|eukprot:CAMPEP_0117445758 /NCGR_PEP_ID=MMETSP0759-20121206/5969_1 /TAXON_ID=63605 /ORGANISM="Percolomonas cosmopolitus, Strain WS" /LENGTH=257 /DNA_ID=CAMNT_0005237961 /DNA_START=109 /DNA_END=882 /DNA_ORIENTATION=-
MTTETAKLASERPQDLSSLLSGEIKVQPVHVSHHQENEGVSDDSVAPIISTSTGTAVSGATHSFRQIRVPSNRFSPLKTAWSSIYTPIVEKLHLQIRMNLKSRMIELRIDPKIADVDESSIETPDGKKLSPLRALQKADDFIQAFLMGFQVKDAVSLIRLDDIYVDSFKLTDVKMLSGANLSRAIGRVSGVKGGTLYTIENATKTRIVLANDQVHILGSVNNIAVAKKAICDLVLGSPPGKVYNTLRLVASRMKESF